MPRYDPERFDQPIAGDSIAVPNIKFFGDPDVIEEVLDVRLIAEIGCERGIRYPCAVKIEAGPSAAAEGTEAGEYDQQMTTTHATPLGTKAG